MRSGLGQELLEEGQSTWVAGLAEPEQCLAPHGPLRVRAGNPDEGGDAGVARLLRQGEDRLLLHVQIEVGFVYQVGKVVGSGITCGLAEPEHRLTAGAPRGAVVAGEPQE